MSGVSVCRYLLANNQALIAAVPAARIFIGVVPLKTILPAISVQEISGQERLTVSMAESSRLRTDRVQVTVMSLTYALQKSILALVRTALDNRTGTVNSIAVLDILPDMRGPDFFESDTLMYMQTQDFMVKWRT